MMTLAAALVVLVLLLGVAISLFIGALPAFKAFGFDFFISDAWSPPKEKFGAAAAIYGTLVTSVIAMVIGVPVGLGIAVFLTELCPPMLRRPIGIAIELLAGIPSIIYGIWGVYYFRPFMQDYLQPFLIDTLGNVPLIGASVRRAAARLRPADRRPRARGDDPALRHRDRARRVRNRAAGAERGGLRRRRDDLRGRRQYRAALHPRRRDRRRHAGAGPRARRDDGGDLRHRQRAAHPELDPRAGHDDLGDDRQFLRRRRSRACSPPRCSRSASSCSSSRSSCWRRRG